MATKEITSDTSNGAWGTATTQFDKAQSLTGGSRRLRLAAEDRGMWLIETVSGSRHLFDMEKLLYSRRGTNDAAPDEKWYQLIDSFALPAVGESFETEIELTDTTSSVITSTVVTSIVHLPARKRTAPIRTGRDVHNQICRNAPTNAWLLIGDDASYPQEYELKEPWLATDPILWTAPRQVQRGDLAIVYFIAPRKAACFAARALQAPFLDPDFAVNSEQNVDQHQWWTTLSPLVPIPAVPFSRIQDLHGGHLILRGKPNHYLTPAIIDGIVADSGALDAEQRSVLRRPVGLEILPDPESMTLTELRTISAGPLTLESMVEQYVVEPFLRLTFPTSKRYATTRQYRIKGAGVADYAVSHDGSPVGVAEAKAGARRTVDGALTGSPDLAQIVRYCHATSVPGILIDSNEIHLIAPDGVVTASHYRKQLRQNDLTAIRHHFPTDR